MLSYGCVRLEIVKSRSFIKNLKGYISVSHLYTDFQSNALPWLRVILIPVSFFQ